ncbi:MAG: hypothetical protein JWN50_102 [Parcubacteria group bacterium]|nr:hypothetical protein [Parcubacteria group bacterium]
MQGSELDFIRFLEKHFWIIPVVYAALIVAIVLLFRSLAREFKKNYQCPHCKGWETTEDRRVKIRRGGKNLFEILANMQREATADSSITCDDCGYVLASQIGKPLPSHKALAEIRPTT